MTWWQWCLVIFSLPLSVMLAALVGVHGISRLTLRVMDEMDKREEAAGKKDENYGGRS